ncbi:MAG: inositol monophosphatase family protein [Pseudomonadota bacterium]|nr:inositol monophosphatase family protein [Pseudomonadota bacterium]
MSNKPFLHTATNLAREASKLILQNIDRLDRIKIDEKAQDDYVSNVDKAVDTIIIDRLQTLYPDHSILTEESGLVLNNPDSDYLWIIDPIDGTVNFINGIPIFCISIALCHKGNPIVGVIYQPITDELFSASHCEGARLNGSKIRASGNKYAIPAITIALGRSANIPNDIPSFILSKFSSPPRIRTLGTAALAMAYQAAGRYQAFYGEHLKIWDVAAAIVIAREAGAVVKFNRDDENIKAITSVQSQFLPIEL